MNDTVKVVRCPCCRNPLYALNPPPDPQVGTWQVTADSPPIRMDGEGHYMKCPRCTKRIGVVMQFTAGQPAVRLSPTQRCRPAG